MKRQALIILLALLAYGCGLDRAMLMETKFDAALRQKLSSLGEEGPSEMLAILGKCAFTVDAPMRQGLIDAGADVLTLQGDIFTANVSSDDVFKVAALEFVTQVQLSRESKPLQRN